MDRDLEKDNGSNEEENEPDRLLPGHGFGGDDQEEKTGQSKVTEEYGKDSPFTA